MTVRAVSFESVRGVLIAITLVLVIGGSGDASGAEAKKVLRAGAFAVDITPLEFPVIIHGTNRERCPNQTSKVVDRLHARCLVLDDGTARIAIAVVDSCVISNELMDEAKRLAEKATGLSARRMTISATHTHSAPAVCGVLGGGEDEGYKKYLPGRIALGIQKAEENLAPARIGWAVGKDATNVFCRRFIMKPGTAKTNPFGGSKNDQAQMNPGYQNANAVGRTGPADPDVSILSVQTLGGEPMALLGNYSTHYAGAPPLSADYFGVFARRVGELIGAQDVSPPFVGIMSNGTSGDANCCDFDNPTRSHDRFSVGEDTAQAAFEAYKTIEYYDWVPLVMAESVLVLDVRMPSDEEVVLAKQTLAKLRVEPMPASFWSRIPEIWAGETVFLSELPSTRRVKLQAIRIGELGIATFPNEVYGATGLAIKRESPLKPTFNISVANGYAGYLPTPDQFPLGGYTTWRARSSCLEVEAEPKIRAEALALLNKVAKQRSGEGLVLSK